MKRLTLLALLVIAPAFCKSQEIPLHPLEQLWPLPAVPVDANTPVRVTILRCDLERWKDTLELEKLLDADRQDMNYYVGHGVNIERLRREDHLFAKIQAERGNCRPQLPSWQ